MTLVENIARVKAALRCGSPFAITHGARMAIAINIEACASPDITDGASYLILQGARIRYLLGDDAPEGEHIFIHMNDMRREIALAREIAGCSGELEVSAQASAFLRANIARPDIADIDILAREISYICVDAERLPACIVHFTDSARGDIARTSVEDITRYKSDATLECILTAPLLLEHGGSARIKLFRSPVTLAEHYAVIIGDDNTAGDMPLVRIHSSCFTGDVLASLRCDCRSQLADAMRKMHDEGYGVLLYLMQEGRGIGLANKLRTYIASASGMDTVQANHAFGFADDVRPLALAATMLRDIGIERARLMTNNPRKIKGLEDQGIEVARLEHRPDDSPEEARNYIKTKRHKLDHI